MDVVELGVAESRANTMTTTGYGGGGPVCGPGSCADKDPSGMDYFMAKVACCFQLVHDLADDARKAYVNNDFDSAGKLFSAALERSKVILDVVTTAPPLTAAGVDETFQAELERTVLEVQLHLIAVHMRREDCDAASQLCDALFDASANVLVEQHPELLVKLLFRKTQILCARGSFADARDMIARAQALSPSSPAIVRLAADIEAALDASGVASAAAPPASSAPRRECGEVPRGGRLTSTAATTTSASASSSGSHPTKSYHKVVDDLVAEKGAKERSAAAEAAEASSSLMHSGAFGAVCSQLAQRGCGVELPSPMEMVTSRKLGIPGTGFCRGAKLALLSRPAFLPASYEGVVDSYEERVYCGRFSKDGSLFVTAAQDWRLRVYDTSRGSDLPQLAGDAAAVMGRWTVTDLALARDNSLLAYSSITPVVYLVSPHDLDGPHVELSYLAESGWCGIWSLALSGDNSLLLAGTSSPAVVGADVATGTLTVSITDGHTDDINSVAFAGSTGDGDNVFVSGSDDASIKVWDLRAPHIPVGVLIGHLEGVAHVASKGDGRFIASNGKDQALKLWDLRRSAIPVTDYERLPRRSSAYPSWDYVTSDYPGVGTGARHRRLVLQTLIRCGFSSPHTTGSRFLYSGSHDGAVFIYDTIGATCAELLPSDRPRNPVRDVAWHPYDARIYTSSWSGDVCRFGIAT
ncbi:WD repeat protein [Thecamonas trahens ATCC 50062]|uniref:WD repeat protein n=1 Tax=Thecamonas trahens ATCC 50062 TaxID=461836 RepID=A0A0L0D8C5_THETB|nr:WD repeat protein [Thecamonas trahens ATCC 50062]KNC48574.1 WD repeat protein [Thecamonas trahens ATCC 50062]|eukprot:XP_013762630.1 WD repeat protein [Thecamonas trahens ATCC 50062]